MYVIISLKKGPKQNRINRLMSSMPEGGDIYTLFRNCKLIHANFMLKIKFLIQFDTSVAQKTNQVYMTLRVGTKKTLGGNYKEHSNPLKFKTTGLTDKFSLRIS